MLTGSLDAIPGLGRTPKFPMKVMITDMMLAWIRMPHPRILACHYDAKGGPPKRGEDEVFDDTEPGRMDARTEDVVRLGDVVYVPLYGREPYGDPRLKASTADDRLSLYDKHMGFVERISGTVAGILVGNDGPEFSMAHSHFPEIWSLDPRGRIETMCEFVEATSREIATAGSVAHYATAPYDVACDCYYGGSMLRDTIDACGAVQMCLGGQLLFGLGQHEGFLWPHPQEAHWSFCPVYEPLPRPKLREHVRGAATFWTGVDYMAGMMAGNDALLSEVGFTGGIVGIHRAGLGMPGSLERWLI